MCKNNETMPDCPVKVDIPVIIDGKTYSIEQAREIWERLDEIFGTIIVGNPLWYSSLNYFGE